MTVLKIMSITAFFCIKKNEGPVEQLPSVQVFAFINMRSENFIPQKGNKSGSARIPGLVGDFAVLIHVCIDDLLHYFGYNVS